MKIYVLILCCTYLTEFGQPFMIVNNLIRITTTNRNGTIASPGYPGHYPNNVLYTWDLETGFRQANVTFFIKSLDIFKNSDGHCVGDYLEIEETMPCCFRHFRRCGKESNVSFVATGNRIRISFLSDGKDTTQGFVLYWHGFLPSSSFSTTFEVTAANPMTTMNNSSTMMSVTTST
ncbi:tumor necrosis factor-inducible gene 6 protein-like [Ostrea edulis]|uniref:tumor necrosis factor-inducible gene 6 protein-like n=1 Tax=Ostrea edulis TaxID=37623 RepID=UPI0024AFA78B|nr:tumor necrosis factor-inducible gene 6 protein-like [Ostrea edulis]